MKIMQPRIGLVVLSAGFLLAMGCAVENGHLVLVPPTINVNSSFGLNNLRQRALHGDPRAQYTLGTCYASGRGCVQNYAEAARWFQRSANQGYAPAQNRLGVCYATGRGCVQNYAEAVRWYQLSANQGYAPAQNNLGGCYYKGHGVSPDLTEAMNWYRKAADQGNPQAQNNLRLCEARSRGEAVNTSEAPPPPAENQITVDEIKEYSISEGLKPDLIIAEIQKTNSKYSEQDIAALQQANVAPAVIDYIKSNAASSPR